MSIFKKIRYRLFPCAHEWVQGAEYWHNKTGENYDYLLPTPMKYHPGWQANCYICTKCGQTITAIEKIEKKMKKLWIARDFDQWNDWDVIEPGNLTIYYDKPILQHFSKGDMWCCVREVANLPTYMFPEIKPGECRVFVEQEVGNEI